MWHCLRIAWRCGIVLNARVSCYLWRDPTRRYQTLVRCRSLIFLHSTMQMFLVLSCQVLCYETPSYFSRGGTYLSINDDYQYTPYPNDNVWLYPLIIELWCLNGVIFTTFLTIKIIPECCLFVVSEYIEITVLLTLLILETEYSRFGVQNHACWVLKSPGHQQAWYWQAGKNT